VQNPGLDYRVYHAVDEFARRHTWLAHAANDFEKWGIVVYAAAVVLLWFAARPGASGRRWKAAALAATISAFVALLVNRVISSAWDRPRPYETHPHAYHLSNSHDPSFPSDHASAAFAIAFAILFFDAAVGAIFLAFATLIATGRVLIGAHYPGDVLAGLGVGLAVAAVIAVAARPLLLRLVTLLERVSDPLTGALRRARTRES
jgi:undecaprenyl-diphosphatase